MGLFTSALRCEPQWDNWLQINWVRVRFQSRELWRLPSHCPHAAGPYSQPPLVQQSEIDTFISFFFLTYGIEGKIRTENPIATHTHTLTRTPANKKSEADVLLNRRSQHRNSEGIRIMKPLKISKVCSGLCVTCIRHDSRPSIIYDTSTMISSDACLCLYRHVEKSQ